MKIPLKPPRDKRGSAGVFSEAEPFVKNERGMLVHRPRHVVEHYNNVFGSHLSVKYYCGNTANGQHKFTFLAEPGEDDFVCFPCEVRAVMSGLPSSSSIVGRHVHTGKIKVIQMCCNGSVYDMEK